MQLKKIRMVGFKSFADETVVETGSGITAIVGPNGCGKSNIVDAVRWVLGEKSGRALRGKSMDDVVFMGSESRRPAGMAEVELVFDNKTRGLPIDADEVSIARRLFLNSPSEYFINGRRGTRRDMDRVFMDTGIGKAAYSIMEQGRMSEILKASPEERRLLFDEAAGVSRFKAEREETMARLHDTEQNLLRLGDILKGRKEEMEHLERQARKTREYLKLKEYMDRHDRNLRYLSYLDLDARRKRTEEKLTALTVRREETFARIKGREEKLEVLDADSRSQVEDMHRMDREFHQALSRIEALRDKLDRLERDKAEKTAKLQGLEARRKNEEKTLQDVKKKVEASAQLELDLDGEIKSLTGGVEHLAKKIGDLSAKITTSVAKEEANVLEVARLERSQAELVEELKTATVEIIEDLEKSKAEIQSKIRSRNNLRDALVEALKRQETSIDLVAAALKSGDIKHAQAALRNIDPAAVLKDFLRLDDIDEGIRSVIFEKTLKRKEDLDRRLDQLRDRKEALTKENGHLGEARKLDGAALEKEKNRKVEMELQIRDFRVRLESSAEARESTSAQVKDSEERLRFFVEEIAALGEQTAALAKEDKQLKDEIEKTGKQTKAQTGAIDGLKKKIEKIREEAAKLKDLSRKETETIERILPEIGELERSAGNTALAMSSLEEELYNDYQLGIKELEQECKNRVRKKEEEEAEYRRIKNEIASLGQFNALAIEEHKRAEEVYEELSKQRADIESAKEDILGIIKTIDEKSEELFRDTFERIQVNFSEIFQTLFNGGHAALTLSNPEDPLSSGVEIMVQPPGKKNSSITLLSGGEQNMTAIALMFATYLVRPSPFCLLDEIDAPLDDSNVNRFLKMLSSFSGRSQFLVITHCKTTMSKASSLFGVTQEEPGISKIVSVRFQDERHAAV